MANVKIIKCTCKNEFQDKRYGEQRRVHNENAKGWICTICKNEKLK